MGFLFALIGKMSQSLPLSPVSVLNPGQLRRKVTVRFEGTQVKAPPLSRSRTVPPTPLQNSCSSFEEEQWHFEVEDQIWSARDRTIIARTKQ